MDFPGKNTGVGCHFLLQGIFLTLGSNLRLSPAWQVYSFTTESQCRRCEFDPQVGKIPWRRKRQPTPVFFPGKSHGLRSLVGYSPQDRRRVRHYWATKQQSTGSRAQMELGWSASQISAWFLSFRTDIMRACLVTQLCPVLWYQPPLNSEVLLIG